MKLSQFNLSFPYKEHYVLFNTFSKESLIINEFLMGIIDSIIDNADISQLKEIHNSFYKSLIKKGFLINSKVDEIDKVKNLKYELDNIESQYYLIVNSTMNCNFKCWYCYESHIKSSKMNEQNVAKVKDFILKKSQNNNLKNFTLSFFGGEPLLYFKQVILPITRYASNLLKKNGVELKVFITTNGFLINDEMIEYFKKLNISHFQITLDGNEKIHNTVRFVNENRGSFKEIVNNIKKLAINDLNITLRVNYTAKNLNNLEDIFVEFEDLVAEKREKIYLSMNQVWQEKTLGLDILSREFEEKAKIFGFRTQNDLNLDYLENSCYADKQNQATINYNGEVFKCNARDFKSENKLGILEANGEIIWNDMAQDRIDYRLSNKPCQSCAILPICGGGCSQLAFENKGIDYCVHNFDEQSKKDKAFKLFLAGLN